MAGYLVNNAQPRGYSLGFKDESRSTETPAPITRPQFFPLMFVLGQRTYDNSVTISGNGEKVLGAKTFEKNSVFYTHQNAFLKKLIKLSNQAIVETIRLPGSAKAFFRLSVEVVSTDIDSYERVEDVLDGKLGAHIVDQYGARKPKADKIRGSKLVLHVGTELYGADQKEFGKAAVRRCRDAYATKNGALISSLKGANGIAVSAETRVFPIADIELSAYGSDGNLNGLRIFSPTVTDGSLNISDLKANRALSYRFMSVKKENMNASADIAYLLNGEVALDATLKPQAASTISQNPISLARTLVPAYSRKPSFNQAIEIGPWGRVKVYDTEIETLLTMLTQGYSVSLEDQVIEIPGEGFYDADPVIGETREDWAKLSDQRNIHLFNLISGEDHNGIPYESVDTDDSVALGGITFANGATHFASGGADGLYYYADGRPADDVNSKLFDDAVRARLREFGMGVNKYKDALRYPFSCIIDSGFSLETKLEMPAVLRIRPDMWVMSALHAVYDINQTTSPSARTVYRDGNSTDTDNIATLVDGWGVCPQQSETIEDATGQVLRARFNLVPESDYYSTPVVRAVIRAQSGRTIDKDIYDGFLPLTYEFMCQCSQFMGAADGVWRSAYDYTREPNNIIQHMEELNNPYRENTAYSKLWELGVVYTQSHDQFREYTSAVQTAYPYDDSVLNSSKMMMAGCFLEYNNLLVHRALVGRDDLTDDEFLEETKRIAESLVEGVFGGQFRVKSVPEIKEGDAQKGYIWRNHFEIYGNIMKTAMIYGVIAKRMSDYTGS